MRQDISSRFWSKVDRRGPDECWLWTGALEKSGYGAFQVSTRTKRRAHRIAWEMTHGPISNDSFVLHTCDVPACCNPSHLYLGTHADNMRDMTKRKRAAYGDQNARRLYPEITERGQQEGWYSHPNHALGDKNGTHTHPERVAKGEQTHLAKLTEDKVREIRRLYAEHQHDQYALAAMFGVRQGTIGFIVRRETWKHVV